MKKSIFFAILLAVLLFFAGCAPQTDITDGLLRELIQKSEAYTQSMANGDFEAVADDVAPSASAQLNAEKLKQAWEDTTAPIGSFEMISATSAFVRDGLPVVSVNCNFIVRGLDIQYTYDANGKIAGMWMAYAAKSLTAQSTDDYVELLVSVGTDRPLEGILTLPRYIQKPPVVLMIAGSGPQDANETVGASGNKPFADIAHGLAQQGVATLRYNKRTSQYPNEPDHLLDLTIQYEVLNDAASAVSLLRDSQWVNPQRIYVLGHSLGGMLAPKIAQDNELAGLISLAGSPRSLLDIISDQNEAAAMAGQITPQQLAQAKALIEKAKNAQQGDTSSLLGATGNYWHSLNQIDTPSIVSSLDIPMLFLQGDADFQVSPEKDFDAWKDALSGKPNAQFRLYSGLTHLFTPLPPNASGSTADYDAPQNVDPQVIADIAAWIKAN